MSSQDSASTRREFLGRSVRFTIAVGITPACLSGVQPAEGAGPLVKFSHGTGLCNMPLFYAGEKKLFALDCASAHQHQACFRLCESQLELPDNRRFRRKDRVELEVTSDYHAIFGSADFHQSAGVRRTLRYEDGDITQHGTKNSLPSPVAGKGSVRDSRVHHRYLDAGFLGKPQEVRPELGFSDDHEFRL